MISANDELVNLFLDHKIKYDEITKRLIKFISSKEFTKFKSKSPKSINEIKKINHYVSLKIKSLSV